MNELATQQPAFSLEPRNLAEAMEFSKIIASSDMVPKHYINKPGNVLVAVQMGGELGLKPMQALQGIAVINGNPGVWGDAMRALVISHPEFEDLHEDKTDAKCTVTLKRRGMSAVVVTYTLDDAKKAGLLGKQGPWQTATKRMLQMRAFAFAARDLFADALKGIKSVEELQDYTPEKDITPAGSPVHQAGASDALLSDAKAAAAKGIAAYQKFWSETGQENRHLLRAQHEELKASAAVVDQARTVDSASTSGAIKPMSETMQAMLADFNALADDGIDVFNDAWGRLSAATQENLAAEYPTLKARAEAAGASA